MKVFALVLALCSTSTAMAHDFTCVDFRGEIRLGSGTMRGLDFKDLENGNYELTFSSSDMRADVVVKKLGTYDCKFDQSNQWLLKCTQPAGENQYHEKMSNLVMTIDSQHSLFDYTGQVSKTSSFNVLMVFPKAAGEPEVVSFNQSINPVFETDIVTCMKDRTFAEIEYAKRRER